MQSTRSIGQAEKHITDAVMAKTAAQNKVEQEFIISDETDLNLEDQDLSQKWDGTETVNGKYFSREIYENLPKLLKDPVDFLVDQNEKEVFLVGAFGVISGLFPKVQAHYSGAVIESNLYTYLLAPYGEGKSSLEYARKLAMPVHRQLKEKAKELQKGYSVAMAKYNREVKAYEKDGTVEVPVKPTAPVILKHFLPTNNSKTGLLQLLHENDGRGTLFETEGDTLADTLKQEYGNFSDLLRNAYHHQQLSYFRRSTGEDVEIESPYLSVVLSSTFDQLVKLIPDAQNGLFSRFLYYMVQSNPEFHDVFNSQKGKYNQYFDNLGQEYLILFNQLKDRTAPVVFSLTEKQQKQFVNLFGEIKSELLENVNKSMGGSVNRLGVMCMRIAMILCTLREYESCMVRDSIICSDQDFENAVRIIEALTKHMMAVYFKLHKPNKYSDMEENREPTKEEQKKHCKELYEQRVNAGLQPNYREIALQALGSSTKHQTAYRWIHG